MYKISVSMRQLAGGLIVLTLLLMCTAAPCFAQVASGNLWQDTSWSAIGKHTIENYGYDGLSYLGKMNTDSGTVENAVAIGETGGSSWILNRKKIDTGTMYFAPGEHVYPGNFSGSGRGDYLIWSSTQRKITVLFSTDTPFVYDTALVLQGDINKDEFSSYSSICVGNFDSSQYDSFVINDAVYSDSVGTRGRVLYYHGGNSMKLDTMPKEVVYGLSSSQNAGGVLQIGNIRDTSKKYLCQLCAVSASGKEDSIGIALRPLGNNFSLSNVTDTIILITDTIGNFTGGFLIDDADGDSIDDIFIGFNNRVLIYKGGKTISSLPTYSFVNPNDIPFGFPPQQIYDIGNFVSSDYKSILVTDPQYGGDVNSTPGGIFLYNIGSALDSNCKGYAIEAFGSGAELGNNAIGIGKYPGEKLDNFMVAERGTLFNLGNGEIYVFHGDSALGTSVITHEVYTAPEIFSLSQNYPNPFSAQTTISFSVSDPRLAGKEITLNAYDALGRYVRTLFRSNAADGYQYEIGTSGEGLPNGIYYYRLACGGKESTKMMNVLK